MEEEIREEKLDSPLVVHKKDDASYQETAVEFDMNATHADEDGDMPTLQRHRFRKEKKSHKGLWVFIAFVAIAVAVVCGLLYSGKFNVGEKPTTTQVERTYTTQNINEFNGIITIKNTYIFFEGTELDGIKELERKIKYLDKGTKFIVQDEKANSDFLNLQVLSLLSKYELDYEIKHIVSSGLESKYETTAPTSTTKAKKTKTTKKASATSAKQTSQNAAE